MAIQKKWLCDLLRLVPEFVLLLKAVVGPRTYRIARLYWLSERSQPEIGSRIGISQQAVSKHLSRARRAARSIMTARGITFRDLGMQSA